MTVIFRSVPVDVPFTFESVGTEWEQPHVVRPEGSTPANHSLI